MMKVPKSVKLAHCNNQKDTFEIVPIAHNIYIYLTIDLITTNKTQRSSRKKTQRSIVTVDYRIFFTVNYTFFLYTVYKISILFSAYFIFFK
jgi:hypothetical protein